MGALILGAILFVIALFVLFVPVPEQVRSLKRNGSYAVMGLAVIIAASGSVAYNDAGYCSHIRTIFGVEKSKCDLGWYIEGWGTSTVWPHYITITHTESQNSEGSSVELPYSVKMSDNWKGDISETTRFGIPQDEVQFLKMARDFRSPERLITTTLRPAVTASLDSVANLYSMEEYWSLGKRDEFKTEFEEAIKKGRPAIDRSEQLVFGPIVDLDAAASDDPNVQDTSENGGGQRTRVVTTKRLDASGMAIRVPHDYINYGIVASSAIVEKLEPDPKFEEQIGKRKEAASRRVIAREQRLEQEEQRLLAIANADRTVAEKQGAARAEQITATTDAETQKKLALIVADQQREQARISALTAKINLEKATIDGDAIKVTADANAYARQKALAADNALQVKIDAEVAIQKVWAEAFAKRNVPSVVMGGTSEGGVSTGGDGDVKAFLDLLTIDAAKRLAYDRTVTRVAPVVPAE